MSHLFQITLVPFYLSLLSATDVVTYRSSERAKRTLLTSTTLQKISAAQTTRAKKESISNPNPAQCASRLSRPVKKTYSGEYPVANDTQKRTVNEVQTKINTAEILQER